jgi:hypothetical protein
MALWESTLMGLGSLVTLGVRYLHTLFLLTSYIVHVVYPDSNCACTTRRTCDEKGVVGFAKRLWITLSHFVFAPWHLPQKLWRRLFPPSCNHNRCKLQRFISPPSPWYHCFKAVYQPIHAQLKNLTAPQPPAFPFLKPQLELRYQIYFYASVANTSHTIQQPSPWRSEDHTHDALYHRTHHALHHTASSDLPATQIEDAISYPSPPPPSSPSTAPYHLPPPPILPPNPRRSAAKLLGNSRHRSAPHHAQRPLEGEGGCGEDVERYLGKVVRSQSKEKVGIQPLSKSRNPPACL